METITRYFAHLQSKMDQVLAHELPNIEKAADLVAESCKNGGRFYLVHRTERLAEIVHLMCQNNLQPKRMSFVSANHDSAPSLVLIEAQKDRKNGLIITKPIYVNL